jgi:hypothetical protein
MSQGFSRPEGSELVLTENNASRLPGKYGNETNEARRADSTRARSLLCLT